MMRTVFGNALIVLFVILLGCQSQSKQSIQKVDKAFMLENVVDKNVQLIDVRTAAEYQEGHIDDAINFDILKRESFEKQLAALDKNQPVYIYCKKGGRSSRAAELMKEMGFTRVYDYSGGYGDWVKTQ